MNPRIKRAVAAGAMATGFLFLAGACASMTEEFNDAPIEKKIDRPAEVYSMPDGFANFASKCDNHGNRIYSTKTSEGRALAVVPHDPSCAKYKQP